MPLHPEPISELWANDYRPCHWCGVLDGEYAFVDVPRWPHTYRYSGKWLVSDSIPHILRVHEACRPLVEGFLRNV